MQRRDTETVPLENESVEPILDVTARALRHSLDGRPQPDWPDEAFRQSLRQACAEARARGLHAEQLIILVRQSWRELGGPYTLGYHGADDAISDVVSLLIREFYSPTRP